MSGIIHKIEEEIKHKMENVLHLGHKEEEGQKKNDHPKAGHGGEGHEHLKELMHKIKNKMGGRGGKKRRAKGGRKEGEEYKEGKEGGGEEEDEDEDDEESESESESEIEEENGCGEFEIEFNGGGEFEFEF